MPWFPRVPTVLVFLTKKRSAASSSPAARSLIPPSCNASSPLHKPRWPRFLPPPAPQSLLPCRSFQPGSGERLLSDQCMPSELKCLHLKDLPKFVLQFWFINTRYRTQSPSLPPSLRPEHLNYDQTADDYHPRSAGPGAAPRRSLGFWEPLRARLTVTSRRGRPPLIPLRKHSDRSAAAAAGPV